MALDAIGMGILASMVCTPFFEPLCHLGLWGRLIGFCVSMGYFGLMDSELGGGQTLGKRLLDIRVVDKTGNTLSVEKAMLRTALLILPNFLNSLPLSVTRTPTAISVLLIVIVLGLGGTTLYMLTFNRQTKQGIHDIAAGSFVVNASHDGPLHPGPIWKTHWLILSGLIVLVAIGGSIASTKLSKSGPFPELLDDARVIESLPGVRNAGVYKQWSRNAGSGITRQTLWITIVANEQPADVEGSANLAAQTLLAKDANARTYDSIRVVITRGYDLGIASSYRSETFVHAPADWD